MHRVLERLILLPKSPVSLNVSKQGVHLKLRNGDLVDLVKNVRYFTDYAGKSFGLTGMDAAGGQRKYVFHKGQFSGQAEFKKIGGLLKPFT